MVFGWRARAGGSVAQQKGGLQLDEEQSLPTGLLQESSITWYVLEYYHKASYRYVSFLLNSQVSESQSRRSPVVDVTQPFLTWCWGWGSAEALSSRLQVGLIFSAQLSEYSKGPKAASRLQQDPGTMARHSSWTIL